MPVLVTVISFYQALLVDWHALHGGLKSVAPARLLIANGVVLLLLGVLFWLYDTSYRVKITDAGVQSRDLLGRPHRVAWNEVLRVENTGNLRLSSATDTVTIRELGFMSKWQSLCDILEQRLPQRVWPRPAAAQRPWREPELRRPG
jgi:hypothetical protein